MIMIKGFKKFSGKLPCRECLYRKKSLARKMQGSFRSQSGDAYFLVLNGIQYYCRKECQEHEL